MTSTGILVEVVARSSAVSCVCLVFRLSGSEWLQQHLHSCEEQQTGPGLEHWEDEPALASTKAFGVGAWGFGGGLGMRAAGMNA